MSSQRSLMRALGWTDGRDEKSRSSASSARRARSSPGTCIWTGWRKRSKRECWPRAEKPVVVPSIGVCDGIAMGHAGMRYSLPSREVIADSAEILARAHAFSGIVVRGQLRQDRPRDADGGGAAGPALRLRFGRADARGADARRAALPLLHVRSGRRPTTRAGSTSGSCTNMSAPPARPAAPARACSRRTASTA